ncbi:hypothetical protein D3C72_2210080 [compost metagenome]
MNTDGVERGLGQWRQARVGLVLRVAHVAVVAVAALVKLPVDAAAGVGVEALQCFLQHLRGHADGPGQLLH